MKIAMVSEHASPLAALGGADSGGQNVHVAALSEALVRLGHDVTVHTRRDDPHLAPTILTASGVTVHHVDAGPAKPLAKDDLLPWMGAFATVLESEWATTRPDVVHAHFWMSGLATLEAARALGIPVVQTFHALGAVKRRHQGADDTSPPRRLELEGALMVGVDRIVATCNDEALELRRLGTDPERISVIPCGVDSDLFRPDGDAWSRGGANRLTMVGRLVARKGVADAIAALPSIPDAELLVAGGPPAARLDADPEAVRLRRLADRFGVHDRFHMLGRVSRSELAGLLRSTDVVVCVPAYEPFGLVPLEAMACGVPVVASAVGGLTESVVDGRTGILVPPACPPALSCAVRRLLEDGPLRRAMGAAGVERARERYAWPNIAARTSEVYAELIAPARAVLR